jgi:hypothetical protein
MEPTPANVYYFYEARAHRRAAIYGESSHAQPRKFSSICQCSERPKGPTGAQTSFEFADSPDLKNTRPWGPWHDPDTPPRHHHRRKCSFIYTDGKATQNPAHPIFPS